ncbi:MAG: FG-GAP-like repeat-containing protein [Candidatus Eiseniibacteriota bacterium]
MAAQWTTQSPVPTYLDVRGVGAPTAARVFLATEDNSFDTGGALWESTDGGSTWIQRDVPESLGDPLHGLFFLDSLNGWTFGNANYRTTDGGTTWTALPFLGSTYFMEFYTASFGLASGNFGAQISLDGGLTWQAAANGETGFDFADALTGLGASATGITRTTDGGATFAPVLAGVADEVIFLSPTVAVGIVDGAFTRSTDGGATWTAGSSAAGRTALTTVSADVVLAWGRTGSFPSYDDRVLRSDDGGQTWTDLGEVLADGVLAFVVPAASVVVAADLDGDMFRSLDAGQTWTQTFASPGPLPSFFSSAAPAFPSATTGYFGYGAGFAIKTTDGGASWTQISSGTGQSLNGMAKFPGGSLIAVGDNGTLLTSAGGTPWIQHSSFTTNNLVAVEVLGAQGVVAVDQTGLLYRSSDAGATWTASTAAPPNLSAADLDFATPLDGWVIGSGFGSGALFHTTDGGASWTPAPSILGGYVAVDFEGANGWAANVSGLYYRTTDGGGSWTSANLPGDFFNVEDMDFWNANVGYAVGWWGYAARSSDAGATWQVLPTPNTTDHLSDLFLVGPNELWASTYSGVAYYSTSGGQTWSVLDSGTQGFGSFAAIVADSSTNAWMAGWQGYIEHFAGTPPPPLNQPPVASFSFVANGLTVSFIDASTDPDGSVVSWAWDFGDGAVSSEQNPTHTYASANTWLVSLTVTDDDGDTGTGGAAVVAQPGPGGTFGDFTEVTPLDPLFVTSQNEDFWVSTTAPADYDGDGDLDIAVLGFYVVYNTSVQERLVLFRNDGAAAPDEWDFTYIDLPIGTLTSGSSDLSWGDVDGDGDDDLAVGTDGQTVIFRNDAGALTLTDTVLPAYWEDNSQADFDLRSITWADYDNDGDQDLLLPSVWDDSTFTYRTALMRNDGANGTGGWVFTEETAAGLAATAHAQSAWADFDGDSDLDLLLVHLAPLTDEGFIRRYRNDGGGAFFAEDILDSLSIEHGEAQWGDYDGDGDLDVLVAGNLRELDGTYTFAALRIYRNDAETYVPFEVIANPAADGWFDLTAATWADYDSDGDVDILLTGTYNSGSQIEGRARVYDNAGGVFTDSGNDLPAPRASASRGGTFTWLDIDGEGDLDYFIAGEYFVPGGNGLIEAQMHLYRNDVTGQNASPSAPPALSAMVDEGTGVVTLSWTAASDDLTPAVALTYDLDVRLNGVPVATPRRLPEPGNVSAVTQWALGDLPDGAYAWTVRAVDSAYNSGPAAAGSFGIGVPVSSPSAIGLPLTFALYPGFPNPFEASTTFRFTLPERADVKLSVYDVSGRLVVRLVDEPRVPGIHDVRWDARGAASGIYFVRLSTPKFDETRRVLRMR